MALLPCQTSDLWMTASLPAVSFPSPSTETISGPYIVRMTSKFFPWLHNSTNWLAIVLRLMVKLLLRGGLFFIYEDKAVSGEMALAYRSDRNASRSSVVKACGCSQAAKWVPLSSL